MHRTALWRLARKRRGDVSEMNKDPSQVEIAPKKKKKVELLKSREINFKKKVRTM